MKRHRLFMLAVMMIMTTLLFYKPLTTKAANIVNPKQTYTYEMMVRDIKALEKKYPDIIQYKIIGNSEYGRPIYAVSLGTGNAHLFINGSHHAREWITTNLNMYMIEQYASMYKTKKQFGGYDVKKVLDETTIWFVPMVNPDGVTLQQFGLSKFPKNIHYSLIKMNDHSHDFNKWKANAKGVDLNRQYEADWKNIKNNAPFPKWSHHKGSAPVQAAEVKSIVKFTKEIDPEMTIAYHSSGEVLYWNFHQTGKQYTRDQNYAKRLGQLTGYKLIYPGLNPSGGGYTDWFIQKYKRPGFTPELSPYVGNTHVPVSNFDRIWTQNRYVGLYTASESYKLYIARGGKPKPQEVNVQIDGKLTKFNQSALLIDGNTVVPVRGVFEHLGATVEWNPQTNTVIARKGTTFVQLTIGSKRMHVNGETKQLSVAPQIINQTTLIPLRAVSEALGAKVGWEQKTMTALITSPRIEKDETPPAPPVVDEITDVTLSVTGKAETNATVIVKKGEQTLGEAIVNSDGKFQITIPAQRADTVLSLTAIDLAGNTSAQTNVTVSYTNTFTDSIDHWAKDAISYLKDEQITTGYADGSFGVNKSITRAEAATLLVRAMNLDLTNEEKPSFADVSEENIFYPYITTIASKNIMNGRSAGVFQPNSTLTRAEMAAILVNAFELKSIRNHMFTDVKQTHWAYEAIQILASNGLTSGYKDGTFKPDSAITRAEFASLLVRVLQLQPDEIVKDEQLDESSSLEIEEVTEDITDNVIEDTTEDSNQERVNDLEEVELEE